MVKKKGDDNHDLTRIEDLSEFLHQEDSDLDSRFDTFSSSDQTSSKLDIAALDEGETFLDIPEIPVESPEEEVSFEDSSETEFEKTSFGENPFGSSEDDSLDELAEVSFGETSTDVEDSLDDFKDHSDHLSEETTDTISEEFRYDDLSASASESTYTNTAEKFEDVKTFAQNFSYGKVSLGGGNPPYTIIARNIKYADDAESILDILREFGIINDQNEKDTQKAMEFGALIIPQISEYTAIVIAHKLRRFDLDLEVGLSDEVHPSKSGMENPRGLLKKDSLKQNRSESLKLSEIDTPIKDIIVSTTAAIPGYFVESYIGVQTTFSIVEESE